MTILPIFVSHSHKDNAACQALVTFLDQQFPGADIFFDQSNLHGGDDWMGRIQREVVARPTFIVVLSRHSVVAEWVREETNLALSRAISDKAHMQCIATGSGLALGMTTTGSVSCAFECRTGAMNRAHTTTWGKMGDGQGGKRAVNVMARVAVMEQMGRHAHAGGKLIAG